MLTVKRIGAAGFAAAVMILSPLAAYASPACMACFGSCDSLHPNDGTPASWEARAQCYAGCFDMNGFPCQGDTW